MLKLVEFRRDANGKQFLAFQGQSDEEAHEMNRKDKEQQQILKERVAAEVLRKRFG